jgi:hypothetical protein
MQFPKMHPARICAAPGVARVPGAKLGGS